MEPPRFFPEKYKYCSEIPGEIIRRGFCEGKEPPGKCFWQAHPDPSFPEIPPATPVGAGEGGGRAGKRGQRGEDWGFPPLPSASELHQDRTRDLRLATPPGLRMSITCCMCNGSVCCPALSAAFPSSAHSRSAWSWVPRRRMPVYLGSANTLCGQQSWHLLAGFLGAAKDWIMMTVESRHELGRFNRNPSHRGKGCASGLSREE